MSDASSSDRGRLARLALIVGVLAGLAAIVGVAWQILGHEDTTIPEYQKQVLATCDNVRAVLTVEHNEVLVVGPDGIRVRKDLMIEVMRNNIAQAHSAFDSLNHKSVAVAHR